MGIDPIIYVVAACLFSVVCGLLAFRAVAAERTKEHKQLRHFEPTSKRTKQFIGVRSLKDILAIVVGMAAAVGAIFYFFKFITDPESYHSNGWIALGLSAVAFVCGLIYFLGHVSDEEDIPIVN